ncbi:hypothetical protein IMSAGC002_04625 [Lachnospiraceae bacterium]|nr:hypothetical protein IMSAGC002_04625 [Lachnospiraceae bacterium]
MNRHLAKGSIIPLCIGFQIFRQFLCRFFIKSPFVKVQDIIQFFLCKIIFCLDDSRIITDSLSPFVFQKKDQHIFRIRINQILYLKLGAYGIFGLLIIRNFRVFYQPLPVDAANLKDHFFYFLSVFIHLKADPAPFPQRSDAVPLVAALHYIPITVEASYFFVPHKHMDDGKRRRRHFHCHVRISLIYNRAGNKQRCDKYHQKITTLHDRFFHIFCPFANQRFSPWFRCDVQSVFTVSFINTF